MTPQSCTSTGPTDRQYFSTSCVFTYSLTGYFKDVSCSATDDFTLYPLGTCTTFPGSKKGGVVYSAHKTHTGIELKYQHFMLSNCSDTGTHEKVLLSLNKTCTPGSATAGSVLGTTTLPALTKHHRYISFYSDSGCSGNVQQVAHMRDGCAPVPGGYANFQCQADGSSTVQLFGPSDNMCLSTAAPGGQFTVQPTTCTAVGGAYMTTVCFP